MTFRLMLTDTANSGMQEAARCRPPRSTATCRAGAARSSAQQPNRFDPSNPGHGGPAGVPAWMTA